MSAMFAATYPERTRALLLSGTSAKGGWAPDYPWGEKPEDVDQTIAYMRENWGKPFGLDEAAPSMADDGAACEWWGAYIRNSASPKTAELITRLNAEFDIREILPTISAPTLVINRENDCWHSGDEARFIADLIPNSTLKLVPGDDHLVWYGDQDRLLGEIEEFLTGQRGRSSSERVLLTILMTDIVGFSGRTVTRRTPAPGSMHLRKRPTSSRTSSASPGPRSLHCRRSSLRSSPRATASCPTRPRTSV